MSFDGICPSAAAEVLHAFRGIRSVGGCRVLPAFRGIRPAGVAENSHVFQGIRPVGAIRPLLDLPYCDNRSIKNKNPAIFATFLRLRTLFRSL